MPYDDNGDWYSNADWDEDEPNEYVECECGDWYWDHGRYSSCYPCYLDRRANYLTCIECGVRWHDPAFAACYHCTHQWPAGQRLARAEATRNRRMHVLYRDRYTCVDCGTHAQLQVDHLQPCAAGGDAWPWNLECRCAECNHVKGCTWWRGCRYDMRRTELVGEYFLTLRPLLTPEENAALDREVARIRGPNYRPPVIDPSPVIDTTEYERDYPELFDTDANERTNP